MKRYTFENAPYIEDFNSRDEYDKALLAFYLRNEADLEKAYQIEVDNQERKRSIDSER